MNTSEGDGRVCAGRPRSSMASLLLILSFSLSNPPSRRGPTTSQASGAAWNSVSRRRVGESEWKKQQPRPLHVFASCGWLRGGVIPVGYRFRRSGGREAPDFSRAICLPFLSLSGKLSSLFFFLNGVPFHWIEHEKIQIPRDKRKTKNHYSYTLYRVRD